MYHYNARNLIISYSVAILFTSMVVGIGFYSIHQNGVAHNTSFSAHITTTRNWKFDDMAKGHSLGALPLHKEMGETKMKFGELSVRDGNEGSDKIHLGFGFAEEVGDIRKKGQKRGDMFEMLARIAVFLRKVPFKSLTLSITLLPTAESNLLDEVRSYARHHLFASNHKMSLEMLNVE